MAEKPNIDPDRTPLNREIFYDEKLHQRVGTMTHQPSLDGKPGRKIRSDANRFIDVVMTLPEELRAPLIDEDGAHKTVLVPALDKEGNQKADENGEVILRPQPRYEAKSEALLDEWVDRSMHFQQSHLPGKLVSVALHMDEETPHLHIRTAPLDERGQLNAAKLFPSGRECFRDLQSKYSAVLTPMGVKENSAEVKAARAIEYVPTVDNLKAKSVMEAKIEKLQGLETTFSERMEARLEQKPVEIRRPKLMEDKNHYWESLNKVWTKLQMDYRAILKQVEQLTTKLFQTEQQLTQKQEQCDELARVVLERAPVEEHVDLSRQAKKAGIEAEPFQQVLNKEASRAWRQRMARERENDLGL